MGQVDVSNHGAGRCHQGASGEVEDCLDARSSQQFGAGLGSLGRDGQDCQLYVESTGKLSDILHRVAADFGSYFVGRAVEQVNDVETPPRKAGKVAEGASQVTSPQQDHSSFAIELHNRGDTFQKIFYRVAQALDPEFSEVGKVLTKLGSLDTGKGGDVSGRDDLDVSISQLGEATKVNW